MTRERRLLATGSLALALGGAASVGAGTAAADPEPIVLDDCSTAVSGSEGQPIVLDTGTALGDLPGLDGLGQVQIGTVPEDGGSVSGASIADALDPGNPLLEPVLQTVTEVCGVTVETIRPVAEPAEESLAPVAEPAEESIAQVAEGVRQVLPVPETPPAAPEQPAPAEPAPETPPAPPEQAAPEQAAPEQSAPEQAAQTSVPPPAAPLAPPPTFGPLPSTGALPDLGSVTLPFDGSPWTSRFGDVPTGDLFGYSPDFGVLGAPPGAAPSAAAPPAVQDVAAAGRATALQPRPEGPPVPEILATLAAAAVLVALVRSRLARGRAG